MKKNFFIIVSFLLTVVTTYSFIFVSYAYEDKVKAYTAPVTNTVLGDSTEKEKLLSPLAVSITASPTPEATPSATATPTATLTPTVTLAPTPITHPAWAIQSVSSMKETKDRVCNQESQAFITQWVDTAKELGVNYISVETPYDNPPCGKSAVAYTNMWISTIRSRGLHIWHRHMFTTFEGIYGTTKDSNKDYLQLMSNYIKANPNEFAAGDIFTPMPEPQNGGIKGITLCPQNICMFDSAKEFNQWLRDAIDVANASFQSIGLGGKLKVGYYGFDGFVTWGNNNPQWHGILEQATIKKMGNITIDHYPEAVGDTMAQDLDKLQKKYPNVPIVIGEWGTITKGDEVQQVINSMGAAKRKNIVGFNYWQMGIEGNEALINVNFSHKPTFNIVESFYTGIK